MAGRYERQRLANIARNNAKLAELGLENAICSSGLRRDELRDKKQAPRKRKRAPPAAPERRSQRAQKRPPTVYSASHAEDEQVAERELQQQQFTSGYRSEVDGRWRGERFGVVRRVEIGTIFGEGDYQRQGRFKMSETGFHVGHVQPEWLDPAGDGCFSLILNNDNGNSRDDGDTIIYAGAGGRRRGQNRTAQQSFDQTWDSAVNAALRVQCANGKPLRVVRGPKLTGAHSTSHMHGGYRYDGLYTVTKAAMERTGPRRLQTCMFTLERIHGQPPLAGFASSGTSSSRGTTSRRQEAGIVQSQPQQAHQPPTESKVIAAQPWAWCEQRWSGQSNNVQLGADIFIRSATTPSPRSPSKVHGFVAGETCCCHCGWTMQAPSRAMALRCANANCKAVIRKQTPRFRQERS